MVIIEPANGVTEGVTSAPDTPPLAGTEAFAAIPHAKAPIAAASTLQRTAITRIVPAETLTGELKVKVWGWGDVPPEGFTSFIPVVRGLVPLGPSKRRQDFRWSPSAPEKSESWSGMFATRTCSPGCTASNSM